MNHSRKISVALCTYNAGIYLQEFIDSLVIQTITISELIVCDDYSTDSTIDILEKFKTIAPFEVSVFRNSSRLGFYRNYEKAISLCNGDFIALADQDDIWHSNKLETLINKIDNHVLIYSDSEFIDHTGAITGEKMTDKVVFADGNDYRNFIISNCISGHSMLFKRDLLKYILPFPNLLYHDWWIAYIAALTGNIIYIAAPLVKYRIHSNNTSDISNFVSGKKNIKKWEAFKRFDNSLAHYTILSNYVYNTPEQKALLSKFAYLFARQRYQVLCFGYFAFWLKHGKALLFTRKIRYSKRLRIYSKTLIGLLPKHLLYRLASCCKNRE